MDTDCNGQVVILPFLQSEHIAPTLHPFMVHFVSCTTVHLWFSYGVFKHNFIKNLSAKLGLKNLILRDASKNHIILVRERKEVKICLEKDFST